MTSDVLPLNEIEKRYDGEWVLMDELVTDEGPVLRAGRVLFHSKDRDSVYQKAIESAPRRFAVRYCGELPEDMEFIL